ncbi:sodium:proton antiporter [Legionella nagasakiensis]|uniref:sodium:proton antiporter n=1 Tax=Legionella nagasakiensis TaxID=535290 RepID=UPI0010552DE0|nr:NADH-quinone oxidoreductase subunit K [Legionella nagasakiensis]
MNLLIVMTGILTSVASYLLMSRQLGRLLYGLILFSSIININILLSGRIYLSQPAFANSNMPLSVNPLPQAMALTAIVISFALIIFFLILLRKLYKNNEFPLNKPENISGSKNKKGKYG